MKNIKYALILSIAAFSMIAFSMTVSAQQGNPPAGGSQGGAQGSAPAGGGGGESRFDLINKAVTLTADQQVKVKAELQKTDEELSVVRKEFTTWNADARAAIDKMWARETERMLKVLNADQKPKYQAWIKAWLEERNKDKH
jgi:hypothetical protein